MSYVSAKPPTTGSLMTPAEAAAALRVTPRTIYLWIRSGKLSAIRVSERVTRIPAQEVDRLLGTPGTPDLSSILWDVDPGSVDLEAHSRLVIARILEAGRPEHVRWMFRRYRREQILEVIESSRQLSHRARVSWRTLLEGDSARAV